jgi:hypothetical protein
LSPGKSFCFDSAYRFPSFVTTMKVWLIPTRAGMTSTAASASDDQR